MTDTFKFVIRDKYLSKLQQDLIDEYFDLHNTEILSKKFTVEQFITWARMKGYDLKYYE